MHNTLILQHDEETLLYFQNSNNATNGLRETDICWSFSLEEFSADLDMFMHVCEWAAGRVHKDMINAKASLPRYKHSAFKNVL